MTPTDITVTGEDFVSVNEVAGVPVGTALELQTKCASAVIVQRKEGKPSATDDNGRVMKSVKNASSIYQVRAGSEEVWLRLNTDNFESEGKVGVYPAVEEVNYVARLNGTDQYWQLSGDGITIPANTDFKIRTSFYVETDSSMIAASSTTRPFIYVRGDGKAVFEPEDGVFVPTQLPVVGRDVELLIEFSGGQLSISEVSTENMNTKTVGGLGSVNLTTLGARIESLYLDGYIGSISIEVNGILTHSIPLTNKAQGATQLPTVGNVSATMIGYTGDEWEEV